MPDVEKRVDGDWKRRAQQEKELISAKTKAEGAAAPAADAKPSQAFLSLVSQLTQQAAYYLGMVEDPQLGHVPADLQAAQAVIGMLEILELRTRGNLAKEEVKLLQDALSELRMVYVEVSQLSRK